MEKKSFRLFLAGHKDLVNAVFVALVYFLVGIFGGTRVDLILNRVIVMALFAMALNLQFGYGGLPNIGGSLSFALGGFFMCAVVVKFHWSLPLAIIFALIAGVVASFILGFICLRNGELGFAFCSMGLTMVAVALCKKLQFFGFDTGLSAQVLPSFITNQREMFFFFFIIIAICTVIIYFFTKSPLMRIVVGTRENEERLTFLGVRVNNVRLVVYVLSNIMITIAGILYSMMNGGAYYGSMDVGTAIEAMLMCVMGGASVFFGPLLGATIVTLIKVFVSDFTIYYMFCLGIVTILVMYFIPDGILGSNGKLFKAIYRILDFGTTKAPAVKQEAPSEDS